MSFTSVLMCIDEFSVTLGGSSLFSDATLQEEVRLNGWFLSGAEVEAMEIVFAAADGSGERRVTIHDRYIWSEGIWHGYGAQFGEKARHCRFGVTERIHALGVDPATGRLRIVMNDGVALERALGVPTRDTSVREFTPDERALVARFESMGENCELGLVQRRVGFERMSLLRFTGVHDPLALAGAIRNRFEGFAEGDSLRVMSRDGEWIVEVDHVHLDAHTGRLRSTMSEADILRGERTKLQFLASKFMEDLEEPERIFVYRALREGRGGPDGMRGLDEIYEAMCSYGGAPRLLWVNEEDEAHPHGTIEHLRDGLYRGWIRRLTPHFNAFAYDTELWLQFLAAAYPVVAAGSEAPGLSSTREMEEA